MLRALEQYLQPLVDAVFPPAVEVLRGPFQVAAAWPPARRVVNVHALRLDVLEVPPLREVDGPAFTFQTATWPINGVVSSFALPPALTTGQLVEVEAPVGRLAKPGDDYYVEGTTIRFFVAPAGPGQARARVRTAAAAGYARRSPAKITLDLNVYTRDLTTAEPLLEDTLHVTLVQLHHAPYFAHQDAAGLGVSVRFSDFRAHVLYLERQHTGIETVVACVARLELVGELDVMIPAGVPAPAGIIEQLHGEVVVEGGSAGPSAPLEIHVEDTDGAGG